VPQRVAVCVFCAREQEPRNICNLVLLWRRFSYTIRVRKPPKLPLHWFTFVKRCVSCFSIRFRLCK
jgi:hypothetical protein